MQNNVITVLFIGDIFGRSGREVVKEFLSSNKGKFDVVIANCENASSGKGLTPNNLEELLSCGIDVLTSGNHIWNKKEIIQYLNKDYPLLRPLNYPKEAPGKGSIVFTTKENVKIGLVNLQGRVFMQAIDCPFRVGYEEILKLKQITNIIIVDFHAEATSEKTALGYYLDGLITALLGTHTHVQTNDAKILPKGTAYITDAGMSGPYESIIGVDVDTIISTYLTGVPKRFDVAKSDLSQIDYVIIEIDLKSGKALSITNKHELFNRK
jgi:metallophosphoesterase (TIGR00282 family)